MTVRPERARRKERGSKDKEIKVMLVEVVELSQMG